MAIKMPFMYPVCQVFAADYNGHEAAIAQRQAEQVSLKSL